MKQLREILYVVCLGGLAVVLVYVCLLLWDCRTLVLRADAAIAEVQATAQVVREYSEEQITRLRDPRQQKSIDAAIQTAAVFNASGRLINTQVIPRVLKTLDSVNETVRTLNATSHSVNDLVQNTDSSLNGSILPAAAETLSEATISLKSTGATVITAQDQLNSIGGDIHRLLSDPSWQRSLEAITTGTENMARTSAQIAEAAKQAPLIAKDLEKISNTSAKWHKWVLIASIAGLLARAFF